MSAESNVILLKTTIQVRYVGEKCLHCGKEFISVDDFIKRNPKSDGKGNAIDKDCWKNFIKEA